MPEKPLTVGPSAPTVVPGVAVSVKEIADVPLPEAVEFPVLIVAELVPSATVKE